jgi:ribosomal-protein-alanine N-acetyltransferase
LVDHVRSATKSDLSSIYRIEVEVFGNDAWHPLVLGFFLYLDRAVFLVYDQQGVKGYAIGVMEKGGKGHVLNIAVKPGYRRKGIGSVLLNSLEAELERLGAREFYLEVREDNAGAISFYEKNGYNPIGVKEKYYSDGCNAVIMWKRAHFLAM